jgi:hypothetical protein
MKSGEIIYWTYESFNSHTHSSETGISVPGKHTLVLDRFDYSGIGTRLDLSRPIIEREVHYDQRKTEDLDGEASGCKVAAVSEDLEKQA